MSRLAVLVGLAVLAPLPARAEGTVLTLDDAIARALDGPRARMARADTDAARARVAEADAARLPRGSVTGFGTASPEIRCENPDCTRTDPDEFAFRYDGLFAGAQLEAIQPIYTFGKISAARSAARAGVAAQVALEDAAAGDVAVDVARAYWGIKLAREIGYMLEDGIEQIEKALVDLDAHLEKGTGDVTFQDVQRVRTLLAEARIQRAEARQNELVALSGLRVLTAVPDADVDDAELVPVDNPIPDAASVVTRAEVARPEVKAAAAGVRAARDLAELESAYHWPDLAVVGRLEVARAQGADEPPSAFGYDPFNKTSGGLVLALRWQVDPLATEARARRARAQARRAEGLATLAKDGATHDARSAHAEAAAARDRVEAASTGETAARAWVAAALQNQAVGTIDAKDLADAYIGLFTISARRLSSIFQWNVAVVRLSRATGEFHAGAPRRKENP
jgi:outer membrane protein TolC